MEHNSEPQDYDMANDPKRKAKSKDVGWKYGFWPDLTNKDLVQCSLCGKKCRSGIKRLKQHLAGNYGDVLKCPKTTPEIVREMQQALFSKKRNIKVVFNDNDYVDVKEVKPQKKSSIAPSINSHEASNDVSYSGTLCKINKNVFKFPKPQPKPSKTVDSFFRKFSKEVVEEEEEGEGEGEEEEEESVHMHIANFIYKCGVPLNVANSRSFEAMVEAIGQYGPGFRPPTCNELRVSLFEKAKLEIDALKEKHELSWKWYGYTLMLDSWTNKIGRHFINFLVNSLEGTFFMSSVDASSQSNDANMLADLINSKIEEIGSEHVVQVVTCNSSNYKAACQIVMEMRPTLFWTPCAAHSLDCMLEDMGKLKDFRATITNGRRITTFIYRHGRLLNAMREKTNGKDLVRRGITRFATNFLTLQSLYRHKDALISLFSNKDWKISKLSTTEAGKGVYDVISSNEFWDGVENCIRATQPLLAVWRIADGHEKPAMPEVLVAMQMAKQKIKDQLDNNPRLYKKVIDIIESRWESHIEQNLYGAALFLNPGKYFDIKEQDCGYALKLRCDFNRVLVKLVPDISLQDKISNLADDYCVSRNKFAEAMIVRLRKKKSPFNWWNAFFGACGFELARFARRVVSLCCSSFGCERSRSTFEFIHMEKRNRLEQKRVSDSVYIQYNKKISRLQKSRDLGKQFDPLAIYDFDWDNEWINNDGEVDLSDDLSWDAIDKARGASKANKGLNLPKKANIATYCRRKGGSASKKPKSIATDSDEDASGCEEELFPNDDEDMEDDYGIP